MSAALSSRSSRASTSWKIRSCSSTARLWGRIAVEAADRRRCRGPENQPDYVPDWLGLLPVAIGLHVGLLFASFGVRSFLALVSESGQQSFLDVSLDSRLVLFTVGLSLLTVVLFGLFPALTSSRSALSQAMRARTAEGAPRGLHGGIGHR